MIDDVIGSWIPELVYLIEVAFPHNAGRNMCLLESHWDSGLETVLYGVSADLLGDGADAPAVKLSWTNLFGR